MPDCTQLQTILNGLQQDLAGLRHPLDFCLKECSPPSGPEYINCLKDCLRSIPERIAADEAAIARVQDEINICGILLKTWNLNANGSTGTLTITSLINETVTDTVFGFIGTISITGESSNTIAGFWYELQQRLAFTRFIDANFLQDYIGYVSTNASTPHTLAGTFTSEDSPERTFGWFATP